MVEADEPPIWGHSFRNRAEAAVEARAQEDASKVSRGEKDTAMPQKVCNSGKNKNENRIFRRQGAAARMRGRDAK